MDIQGKPKVIKIPILKCELYQFFLKWRID